MNNVYFVYCVSDENVGRYVATNNKGIAIDTFKDNNCLDCNWLGESVSAKLTRDHYPNGEYNEEGVVFATEYEGVLDVEQIYEVGIIWFQCDNCGDDDFKFIDNGENYKCKACGHADRVPYAN